MVYISLFGEILDQIFLICGRRLYGIQPGLNLHTPLIGPG